MVHAARLAAIAAAASAAWRAAALKPQGSGVALDDGLLQGRPSVEGAFGERGAEVAAQPPALDGGVGPALRGLLARCDSGAAAEAAPASLAEDLDSGEKFGKDSGKNKGKGDPVCLVVPQRVAARRVVSVADVHGDMDAMLKLLSGLNLVNPATTRDFLPEDLWAGGNTHFIQLGDVVDYGADGREMYRFLWKLQDDAHKKTQGTVDLLIGNHELFLLQGIHQDVASEMWVEEQSGSGPGVWANGRHKALCSYVEDSKACLERGAKGFFYCADDDDGLKRRAAACVKRAWGKEGAMGSEARKRLKMAVQFGDSVFVHAGLLPKLWKKIGYTRKSENGDTVAAAIDWLNGHFATVASLAMEDLAASSDVTVDPWDPDGPAWTRVGGEELDMQPPNSSGAIFEGYDEKTQCEVIEEALEFLFDGGAVGKRMVIGHNQVVSGRPFVRCQGRLILTDTIMSRGFWPIEQPISASAMPRVIQSFDARLSALETLDSIDADVWSVQPASMRPKQGTRCVLLSHRLSGGTTTPLREYLTPALAFAVVVSFVAYKLSR